MGAGLVVDGYGKADGDNTDGRASPKRAIYSIKMPRLAAPARSRQRLKSPNKYFRHLARSRFGL
jgi:hypothetical protein